ncbi:MAG: chromosomal replication initiator protein DnaA [Acidobacteriota bacterium]
MNKWDRVLQQIEKRVNKHSFRTWFQPTRLLHERDGTLFVGVPNTLFLEWINSNYRGVVNDVIGDLETDIHSVSFECPSNSRPSPCPASSRSPRATAGRSPTRRPTVALNPRYTFEAFVVSSCNQFAHAATQAVAEKPSHAYNPLYIYGGVGLGKTHLMHAIGNRLTKINPRSQLHYITSENFMNELINCIRFEKTIEFKEKYRNVDILLVDDVQFLQGKERTQEEFFHTFNQLYEMQKQIVITSDCRPREIPALEERLRSRFEWGLIADIQPPDLETKVAILRKKAEAEELILPQEVALYVASKVKSNIRELEGCLVRIMAYASLTGRLVDLDLATETLKDILDASSHAITVESIQRAVADHYHISVADLKTKNNSKRLALPRHVAMYIAKQLTDASLPELGRRFGNKHHSTVLHAVRKIHGICQADPDFDRQIHGLMDSFQ